MIIGPSPATLSVERPVINPLPLPFRDLSSRDLTVTCYLLVTSGRYRPVIKRVCRYRSVTRLAVVVVAQLKATGTATQNNGHSNAYNNTAAVTLRNNNRLEGPAVSIVLITTAPDGTETRSGPITHGPAVIHTVAATLAEAAPWLTDIEARRLGLSVARAAMGITSVHTATGYRFRVESPALATV